MKEQKERKLEKQERRAVKSDEALTGIHLFAVSVSNKLIIY
jgi:hypothetical protein